MKIEDFTKAMKVLGTIYNKDFDQDTVKIWYAFFKDTNYEDLQVAIKRVAVKEKFFPSVARLKEEISTITTPELQLDVDEEWNKVRHCIRTYGPYKEEEAMNFLNPITRKIVEGMGYQRLMEVPTNEMQYEYARFKESFKAYTKSMTEVSSINEGVRTLLENKRIESLKPTEEHLLKENSYE